MSTGALWYVLHYKITKTYFTYIIFHSSDEEIRSVSQKPSNTFNDRRNFSSTKTYTRTPKEKRANLHRIRNTKIFDKQYKDESEYDPDNTFELIRNQNHPKNIAISTSPFLSNSKRLNTFRKKIKKRPLQNRIEPEKKKAKKDQNHSDPIIICLSDSEGEIEEEENSIPFYENLCEVSQSTYLKNTSIHPFALCTDGSILQSESSNQTVVLKASCIEYSVRGDKRHQNYISSIWMVCNNFFL